MSTSPVLSVKDLHVSFNTENGVVHAVRGVDFDLYAGKTLGIVGESGSGKSVASMAIMGLHPTTADITGSITYNGTELLGLSDKEMCQYRGKHISMIFQDPLSSLTPVYTIGDQIAEVLKIHNKGMSKQAIKDRSIELMRLVGIPSPADRLRSFPHEFSGGRRWPTIRACLLRMSLPQRLTSPFRRRCLRLWIRRRMKPVRQLS